MTKMKLFRKNEINLKKFQWFPKGSDHENCKSGAKFLRETVAGRRVLVQNSKPSYKLMFKIYPKN